MPVDKKVKERHLLLDELFRNPEGMTYDQIQRALQDKGYNVSIRTIQQDITYFQEHYQAKFKGNLRKGHSVLVRYEDTTRSVLNKSDIVEKLLEISKTIQEDNDVYPHFVLASSIIQHLAAGNPVDDFYDAVDFGSNQYLTGIENFGDILRAIINKQCISFEYKPYNKGPNRVTVSPYKLKQYNQRWYLICKTIRAKHYSLDALDRIQGEVTVSNAPFEEPYAKRLVGLDETIGTHFALDENVEAGDILLRVSKERYPYIESKPIHVSQECVDSSADTVTIKLRVKLNPELKSQILSFGDDIEVIYPPELRSDISHIISNLSEKYGTTTK